MNRKIETFNRCLVKRYASQTRFVKVEWSVIEISDVCVYVIYISSVLYQ